MSVIGSDIHLQDGRPVEDLVEVDVGRLVVAEIAEGYLHLAQDRPLLRMILLDIVSNSEAIDKIVVAALAFELVDAVQELDLQMKIIL